MCLRNGRTAAADIIVMELTDVSTWTVIPEGTLNEKGDLIDPDNKTVLLHGRDTILNKRLEGKEFEDQFSIPVSPIFF